MDLFDIETASEQTYQADNNQIDGNNIVQQTRYHQNKNSCDQRYQWGKAYIHVHIDLLGKKIFLDEVPAGRPKSFRMDTSSLLM